MEIFLSVEGPIILDIIKICSPAWTRTTNYCLEGSSYIPLTTGPKYLGPGSNWHGHYCPRDFKSLLSTYFNTEVSNKDSKKIWKKELFLETF